MFFWRLVAGHRNRPALKKPGLRADIFLTGPSGRVVDAMTTMHWEKSFEVGHEKIDFEHRIFFDLIASVRDAAERGASRDRLRRLLAETHKYAEFHFLSEENVMIDCGFPSYEEHRDHHRLLIRTLLDYVIEFETGKTDIAELLDFLVRWFTSHTTREDMELSRYIRGQGH